LLCFRGCRRVGPLPSRHRPPEAQICPTAVPGSGHADSSCLDARLPRLGGGIPATPLLKVHPTRQAERLGQRQQCTRVPRAKVFSPPSEKGRPSLDTSPARTAAFTWRGRKSPGPIPEAAWIDRVTCPRQCHGRISEDLNGIQGNLNLRCTCHTSEWNLTGTLSDFS
jgi:hypothetical protein